MPTPAEVLFYLRGLWLLFKADPSAARYLDFTERGFRRSFWALAYSFPFIVGSELLMLTRLSGYPVALTSTMVIRAALIQGLSWMIPLVVLGLVCMISGLPRSFPKIVVATNWLSLPVNLFANAAILLVSIQLQPIAGISIIMLQVVLLAAFVFEIRIVYLLMEEKALPTAAAIIASAISALIITDFGTRYLLGG